MYPLFTILLLSSVSAYTNVLNIDKPVREFYCYIRSRNNGHARNTVSIRLQRDCEAEIGSPSSWYTITISVLHAIARSHRVSFLRTQRLLPSNPPEPHRQYRLL